MMIPYFLIHFSILKKNLKDVSSPDMSLYFLFHFSILKIQTTSLLQTYYYRYIILKWLPRAHQVMGDHLVVSICKVFFVSCMTFQYFFFHFSILKKKRRLFSRHKWLPSDLPVTAAPLFCLFPKQSTLTPYRLSVALCDLK